MKKYVHTKQGVFIIEYPISEEEMQLRFPEYAFPLEDNITTNVENNGFSIPVDYYEVQEQPMPLLDETKTYRRVDIKPCQIGPRTWKEQFIMVEENEDATAKEQDIRRVEEVHKRNMLLHFTDRYVVPDRWDTYTDAQKQELTEYRQALRDLDYLTPDDPKDIVWPDPPAILDLQDFAFNY